VRETAFASGGAEKEAIARRKQFFRLDVKK